MAVLLLSSFPCHGMHHSRCVHSMDTPRFSYPFPSWWMLGFAVIELPKLFPYYRTQSFIRLCFRNSFSNLWLLLHFLNSVLRSRWFLLWSSQLCQLFLFWFALLGCYLRPFLPNPSFKDFHSFTSRNVIAYILHLGLWSTLS